jgi:hypothetical protein
MYKIGRHDEVDLKPSIGAFARPNWQKRPRLVVMSALDAVLKHLSGLGHTEAKPMAQARDIHPNLVGYLPVLDVAGTSNPAGQG